jgi:DNA-binding MarR family transcriptional regulator
MKSIQPGEVECVLRDYPRIFLACHRRHRRDPASGREVSEGQARLIDHLDEWEPMGLSSLARHMGLTPGTLSVAVTRLVRRGLVRRRRDPRDSRRIRLWLTPAGARLKEAQSVLDVDLVEGLLMHLDDRERGQALGGLALLARAATSMTAGAGPAGDAGRGKGGKRKVKS